MNLKNNIFKGLMQFNEDNEDTITNAKEESIEVDFPIDLLDILIPEEDSTEKTDALARIILTTLANDRKKYERWSVNIEKIENGFLVEGENKMKKVFENPGRGTKADNEKTFIQVVDFLRKEFFMDADIDLITKNP